MDKNECVRVDSVKLQTGAIERALFEVGEILADPDERRLAAGGKARGQCQGEAGGGWGIAGTGSGDLMQGANRKAACKHVIELCLAERDAHARVARRRMRRRGDAGDRNTNDLPTQKAEPPRCAAPMRKGLAKPQKLPDHISRPNVPYLFSYGFLFLRRESREEGVG